MTIIQLVVTLIVIGILLGLLNYYARGKEWFDAKILTIINIVVIVIVILWLLAVFGVIGVLDAPVPRVR